MEKFNLPKFLIAHCDETQETPEERIQRLKDAGLTDAEITKLGLNIPDNVLTTLQSGQRLFTQEDLTKARKTERQRVEGNLKYKKNQPPVTDEADDEEDEEDEVEDTPVVKPKSKSTKMKVGESVIPLQTFDVQAEIAKALEPFQAIINTQKQQIESLSTDISTDKEKKVATHKASLLSQLPEQAHTLLTGSTIEELDASFAQLTAFISSTTKTSKAQNAAGRLVDQRTVFTAKDGKKFTRMEDLVMPENTEYLAEYKAQFN